MEGRFGRFDRPSLATSVVAQRTTGGITGSVKDGTGAVLPGVTVDLTGEYVMGAQTSVTNENGVYRFLNLAPGTYNLAFTIAGFAPFNRNGLVVALGMTTEENVTMQLSSVSESVTVTGASPVVDTIASDVSTNYDNEWVDNAPVARNSFYRFHRRRSRRATPRRRTITNAMVYGSARSTTTPTSSTARTSPITSSARLSLPRTPTPSRRLRSSPSAPRRSTGAFRERSSISSPSRGATAFHGDANFYYQADGLTGRNTTEEEDDGFPYYRDSFPDFTGQIGGPIKKDKIWFFGSYQKQIDASSPVGVDPVVGTTEQDRGQVSSER